MMRYGIWDMGYVAIWDTYNTYGTTIAHAPHRISIRGGKERLITRLITIE